MTITRIGSATGVNSLTMPTHAAGDLLLMFAYRDGSTTAPALPAGWTDLISGGTASNSCRIAYKIAASGSEVSGTWTSATSLICVVYRSDGIIGVGGVARSSSASTTVSYPALTMVNTDGTSWVAGFGGHRSVNTSIETPPTGMTNITSVLDATDEAAAHDTNGTVSSWSLQTVSVGGTSSGWNGATVEITDEPLPVPPSGDNPCAIMASASEVDLFFDAAASDLFEDTAGTTAATTDGDPVNFIASLWGSDFVAGASSGRNAVLRLPSGDDPYLEAVPGSSQLRASLARSGDLYVICRGRWNGTSDNQETFWTLTNNATQFYSGNFITPKYFPFGFNYIQTESSIGYAVTTSAVAITRGAWATLEIYVVGDTIYTAVDGGSFESYVGSGAFGDTTLMDIFGSLDGGVTGSFAVDIRRLAVLNVIPDSTERTNLLDWAENGDAGGSGASTGEGTVTLAALTVSGAGTVPVDAEGTVTLAALTVSGAGTVPVDAEGTVTLAALTVSGAGTADSATGATAEGTITFAALTVAGSGTVPVDAEGTITFAALTVAGSGTVPVDAEGTITFAALTVAGSGMVLVDAEGTVTLAALTVAGSGTVLVDAEGTVTLAALTVAGSGSSIPGAAGAGAVTLAALTVSGAGTVPVDAEGTVTLAALTVAGSGMVPVDAEGTVTLAALTVAGAGTIEAAEPASGEGTVTLAALTVAGAGFVVSATFVPPRVNLRRGKSTRTESELTAGTRGRYVAGETFTVMT